MRCPACGNRISNDAVYCQQCGSRVRLEQPADDRVQGSDRPQHRDFGGRSPSGFQRRKSLVDGTDYLDEEVLVWAGTYSWKGMIHEFLLAALATALLVAGGSLLFRGDNVWPVIGIFVGFIWLLLLAVLAFRKLSFHYRITDQRLIHETGILYRVLDRTEMIDVDDVRVEQDIIERIANVGKIRLRTSDHTHPYVLFRGIDRARDVADLIDDARRRERMRRGIHVEAV